MGAKGGGRTEGRGGAREGGVRLSAMVMGPFPEAATCLLFSVFCDKRWPDQQRSRAFAAKGSNKHRAVAATGLPHLSEADLGFVASP